MIRRFLCLERQTAILALLATTCFISCNSSQPSHDSPRPAAATTVATSAETVSVIFEGPWAFVDDPQDSRMVLAIAPKTAAHHDLRAGSSNLASLDSGTYSLSVPAHGAPASSGLDPSFVQAKIDAKSLQAALENKTGHYVVRLPKPEAYRAVRRLKTRVGASYPPDATTEQGYATSVSLRYTVSSLSGFSLSGTPDSGTFNPLLFQVETPIIQFVIEPSSYDPLDKCDLHARQAFRDLVKLLNVKLYLDFPDEAPSCQKNDPQTRAGAADFVVRPFQMAAFMASDLPDLLRVQPARNFAAYLFAIHLTDCKVPTLFLTVSP